MKRSATIFLSVAVGLQLFSPCFAQMWSTGPTGPSNQPQTPQTPPQVSIPQPQPAVVPRPDPPRIPVIPRTPMMTPLNPRDLVSLPAAMDSESEGGALDGIKNVEGFPVQEGPGEGILVKHTEGTEFCRPSETSVALKAGSLLVSVRRPTRCGLIDTAIAEASVGADAEVLVSYSDGIFRLINLTGHKENVTIRLKEPIGAVKTISLKPGYEFLVGDRPLKAADLRASDDLARRRCRTMEDGRLAVCEVSVESALRSCELITSLNREESEKKNMRILSDMSKMAAVLNYVHGVNGYRSEPRVTLEVKSQVATK